MWSNRNMLALRQLEIVKGCPSIEPGNLTEVSSIRSSTVKRLASISCRSDLRNKQGNVMKCEETQTDKWWQKKIQETMRNLISLKTFEVQLDMIKVKMYLPGINCIVFVALCTSSSSFGRRMDASHFRRLDFSSNSPRMSRRNFWEDPRLLCFLSLSLSLVLPLYPWYFATGTCSSQKQRMRTWSWDCTTCLNTRIDSMRRRDGYTTTNTKQSNLDCDEHESERMSSFQSKRGCFRGWNGLTKLQQLFRRKYTYQDHPDAVEHPTEHLVLEDAVWGCARKLTFRSTAFLRFSQESPTAGVTVCVVSPPGFG